MHTYYAYINIHIYTYYMCTIIVHTCTYMCTHTCSMYVNVCIVCVHRTHTHDMYHLPWYQILDEAYDSGSFKCKPFSSLRNGESGVAGKKIACPPYLSPNIAPGVPGGNGRRHCILSRNLC